MRTLVDIAPDQTPRSVASGRGMHCLPMSHKKVASRIWVNITAYALFSSNTMLAIGKGQIFAGMMHSFPGITHVAEVRRCGYVHKMKPTG